MPVSRAPNGKWRIGRGKGIYPDKATADKAYKGYQAAVHMRAQGIPPKKKPKKR